MTPTENPYIELHGEFRKAGADVLISSGQACVLLGIAAFSKDGDWIVREDGVSCDAVRNVLSKRDATYRLGVPLSDEWMKLGLTSHFEYTAVDSLRIRADFCSRPPRVPNVERLWNLAIRTREVDVVDVESLILLKQTRRQRDYSIIGAIAEVGGMDSDVPEIALNYLQDFEMLSKAVRRWPEDATRCDRRAVRLLRDGEDRAAVVAEIALEQDQKMQADRRRIDALTHQWGDYGRKFTRLRSAWIRQNTALADQHLQLCSLAADYFPKPS